MSKKIRLFYVLRFTILQTKQKTLSHLLDNKYKGDEDKQKLFKDAFLRNNLTVKDKRGNEYYILGVKEIKDNIYVGKFAKKKYQNTPKKEKDDIKDTPETVYPYSYFICDLTHQFLIIEQNKYVFIKLDNLCKLLSDLATKYTTKYGYIVDFNPVVEKRAFWELLKESKRKNKKVQYLKLKLNAPNLNLLNETARKSLKILQETFNITQVEYNMKNPEEGLTIDENKGTLKDYIDYIEDGGGSWEVKIESEGVIKSHSKTAKIKTKLDDKDSNKFIIQVLEIINDIRKRLLK